MIPITLTIQGLYSYQDKQTIDFTQLTAASLFGIFGSVGSGKSSILEAITFAIYGRTDRLNLSGDNRYYNMMNLKSDELLIDFVFETGKDQSAYQVTVKGKRNSKKFEDVKTLERAAYQKFGNEWMPVELSVPENAIGLSYDNFKRTIIIPQGQFQEFLQLGNKDRTQMMKELFNLEKFEFYGKVASLESKNNAQKQNIEGQLQQLGEIDPEQLNVYQKQLEEITKILDEKNAILEEQQKEEEAIRKLKELTQKKAEAENSLKSLQEKQPDFEVLEKKIARYEQAILHFKPLLDALKSGREKVEVREKQIQLDETKLKETLAEIAKINQQLEVVKPEYEKREELKKRAEELQHLLHIHQLETDIEKEKGRFEKGNEVCRLTKEKLEELKQSKNQLEQEVRTQKVQMPDVLLLSEIRNWHTEFKNLQNQLKEQETIQDKIKAEMEIKHKELMEIINHNLFENLTPNADFATTRNYLDLQNIQLKEANQQLQEKENHLRVKAQLQVYSESLHNGQPCPLCGALDHPEVFKADDIHDAQKEVNKEKATLEEKSETVQKFSNRISLLEEQQKQLLRQKIDGEEKKKALLEKIEQHKLDFKWEQYRDEEELNKAFASSKVLQENLKKLEEKLEEVSKSITKEEGNKERYQAEVDKIQHSITVHQTQLETLFKQLQLIQPDAYKAHSTETIEAERQNILQKYTELEKQFIELNESLTNKTRLQDTLSGSLNTNKKELEKELETITQLYAQLQERLADSIFNDLDELNQLLAEVFNPEAEKKKLADFKEQRTKQKNELESLQKEIAGKIYNEEAHLQLSSSIHTLKEELSLKNQEQGRISELLKKLENDLKSQADLRKDLQKLELRADNIKTMKGLFKASGFVNYISSVYLQNLCKAANDRFFQLTKQKLSLEITSDNNFQVRDYLNGGKVRSVKTLSGGQTFQAALSLALALADNIQKITESNQNFFFLDEGFGSLDKDSLTIVFDTLKALRKENRIVGVISHVEEMQQEIDVHLRITNDETKGSKIIASWRE